jgi:hypothetical protein
MRDIIKKINTATMVLSNIDVRGKNNLLNLGGAIDLLEGVAAQLTKINIENTLNKDDEPVAPTEQAE